MKTIKKTILVPKADHNNLNVKLQWQAIKLTELVKDEFNLADYTTVKADSSKKNLEDRIINTFSLFGEDKKVLAKMTCTTTYIGDGRYKMDFVTEIYNN